MPSDNIFFVKALQILSASRFLIIEWKPWRIINITFISAERFSSATAKFTFKRRSKYFVLQVYIPCILIVMVTWASFWITPTAAPARTAICVTTILTLITMLGIVNANMPKVSYIKALDLYLFVAFIFVLLSLLEYILVLNLNVNYGGINKFVSLFSFIIFIIFYL